MTPQEARAKSNATNREPLRPRHIPKPSDRPAPLRYVRMVKTGSTSIANWLIDNGYGKSLGHAPGWYALEAWREIPGHEHTTLWGTVRHPLAWYRSWYAHCMRNYPNNHRALASMQAYGGGSHDFRDVLWGLTHPRERSPQLADTEFRDHLLNPAGWFLDPEETEGAGMGGLGLWSRSVLWFFGHRHVVWWDASEFGAAGPAIPAYFGNAAGPWSVSWLVDLDHEEVEAFLHRHYPEAAGVPLVRQNSMHTVPDEIRAQLDPAGWDPEMARWVLDADGEMVRVLRSEFGVRLCVPEGVRV